MTPFEIFLLAGVADVKLSRKPGLGFMLKNGQNTIYFLPFLPSKQRFCVSFSLPRPKRRAQVRSKIITTPKKPSIYSCIQRVKTRIKSSRQR